MQVYELARRSVLAQGQSVRKVSLDLGLNWRTVRKMVAEPVPPGYRQGRPRARPKLGPFLERIEEILREDEAAPPKQRHTAAGAGRKVQHFGGRCRSKSAQRDYGRSFGFVPMRCTACRYTNWRVALSLPRARAFARFL